MTEDTLITFDTACRKLRTPLRGQASRVRGFCSNAMTIDDLVQEALLGAFLAWDSLRVHPNPIGAMYTKCRWLMLDAARGDRWGGRRGAYNGHIELDGMDGPGPAWTDGITPEHHMHATEMAERISEEAHNHPRWLSVIPRLLEGASQREIAEECGVTEGRVSQVVKEIYDFAYSVPTGPPQRCRTRLSGGWSMDFLDARDAGQTAVQPEQWVDSLKKEVAKFSGWSSEDTTIAEK